MGSVLLFLAIVLIVALIVYAADRQLKAELGVYTWISLPSTDPAGNVLHLTARVGELAAVLALDRLDLSPQVLTPGAEDACVYCRSFVPHTRAACIATFDRYGRPELADWGDTVRSLRAFVVAAQVQRDPTRLAPA
jgi:hypothetical protein